MRHRLPVSVRMLSCAAAQNRKHREGKGQACLMQSCCSLLTPGSYSKDARPKRLADLWHILLQHEWILSTKPSSRLIYSLGRSEIHSFWEQFDFWVKEREKEWESEREREDCTAGFAQASVISGSRQGQQCWKSSVTISLHMSAKHRPGRAPTAIWLQLNWLWKWHF